MSQPDIYGYTKGASRETTNSTDMRNKEDIVLAHINVLLKNNTINNINNLT